MVLTYTLTTVAMTMMMVHNADGYGIAANYGLGGGATVMVGYGNGTARTCNS